MLVSLQIVSGIDPGTRIQLKSGQVARFGRTEWADFAFPRDAAMADVHFEMTCGARMCSLRDLGSGQPTQLNGQPIQESILQDGQRITAGNTTFLVRLDSPATGSLPDSTLPETIPRNAPNAPARVTVACAAVLPLAAPQLCEKLGLDPAAAKLAAPNLPPLEFAETLVGAAEFASAMRVLAYWLPKRKAVWWGAQCLRATEPAATASGALAAAEAWVLDPTDANRRAAQLAAQTAQFDGPASWVALAAFWSGGSMAPPDAPPLPPGELLTSQGISGALMLAATRPPTQQAGARYRSFLNLARELSQTRLSWET